MTYDPWLWKTIKAIPWEEEQINVLEKQGLSLLSFTNNSVELKNYQEWRKKISQQSSILLTYLASEFYSEYFVEDGVDPKGIYV